MLLEGEGRDTLMYLNKQRIRSGFTGLNKQETSLLKHIKQELCRLFSTRLYTPLAQISRDSSRYPDNENNRSIVLEFLQMDAFSRTMRDKTSSAADFRSTPLAKHNSRHKSNEPAMTNYIYCIVQYSTNIHF